ncbi:hypothetical protein Tco_0194145 [Tanacetum coccineum]
MELCDYENDLKLMRRNVLYRGVSPLSEIKSDSLKAGITLQFKEINVLGIIPNNLNGKMKEKQTRMIKSKKNKFEPTKTLNEMKISLTYMEWYMKSSKAKGGYNNGYKNPQSREEIEKQQPILRHKRHRLGKDLDEALIVVKELRDEVLNNNKGDIKKGLEQFEAYLMLPIKNLSVSPDIFLEGSVTPPKLGRNRIRVRERYFIIPLHKA